MKLLEHGAPLPINPVPQLLVAYAGGLGLIGFGVAYGYLASIASGLFFLVFFTYLSATSRATLYADRLVIRRFAGNADLSLLDIERVEPTRRGLVLHLKTGKRVPLAPFRDARAVAETIDEVRDMYRDAYAAAVQAQGLTP